MLGLYFHVPFCKSKCPYCDFYSLKYRSDYSEKYTEAVIKNIIGYSERYGKIKADTVYFGGGTPTLLDQKYYKKIFLALNNYFDIAENAEISLEANPVTITPEFIRALSETGFNRISIGVQSMNDNELKILGRLHDSDRAEKSILCAYDNGIKNISADIMLGIIEQTQESITNTLNRLSKLPISHISAYILKIEEGTVYAQKRFSENIPDDDTTADLYLSAVKNLKKNGFNQYEISNFSKSGSECRHNIIYWNSQEYIGIGPSAHSYYNGIRYFVPDDFEKFCSDKFQTEFRTDSSAGTFFEYAMLKIRLSEGLDLDECSKKYDINKDNILQKCIPLEKNNLVIINKSTISLTPLGCLVSNEIICRLFL